MSLANEIKLIRQKAFLTQEEFAKQLNVAFSTVNRWESGKIHPNITAIRKIKQFCDKNKISFDDLQQTWLGETDDNE